MNKISANEMLDTLSYQWAGTKEIMKLGSIGESTALRIKREITKNLKEQGYALPRNQVPMESVVSYFKINIDFLKKVVNERKNINE